MSVRHISFRSVVVSAIVVFALSLIPFATALAGNSGGTYPH